MRTHHTRRFQVAHPITIHWQGRSYTIAEAGVLVAGEVQQGRFQAAADLYRLILAKVPDCAEFHNNLGVIWQRVKEYGKALACYDKAITLKPGYANAYYNRGSVLEKMSRPDEALASYNRAIALNPAHAEACNNRGIVLQATKRYDEALASYNQAIAIKPAFAEACNNLGTALVTKGNMSEAEKMFLKASALRPDFPDPWYNLTNIRQYRNPNHTDAEQILRLLNRPGITPGDQEYLNFALGKIYDDCGCYDEAFDCLRQANRIRNTLVAYNPAAVERMTEAIMEVFTAEFLVRTPAFASDSSSPLFVVGMPGSGTTLVASILSNHPRVATAGELPTLPDITSRLIELTENGIPFPEATKHITPSTAANLIDDYERRLRRDVSPDILRVVDKNPLNFRNLGFISRLFPKARIIHCTRDPRDTGLSNYFRRFPLHLDYSFDLHNIGHYYRQYTRLMEHWRSIPNLALLEVSYEQVIRNTEPVARRMLDWLGLEWSERCLAPHTNPCAVETASQWQVRQPIYRHSLGRWRHYEKHLAPLMEMLPADSREKNRTFFGLFRRHMMSAPVHETGPANARSSGF